jgi:HD-GYP domain-containing protein (c-di-GMP phosphodiesterase class II)
MNTILSFLPDKIFLTNTFSYLETCHSIRALIVNKDGRVDPLDGQETNEYLHTKLYPVSFHEDIGGIRCSAESMEALAAADPHICICIAGIENLLEKNLIIQQTMEEMLRLSDQLHFLFGLAAKLSGVHDVQHYCTLVIQEITQAVSADSAFVHISSKVNDQRHILQKLSTQDLERVERDPALQSLPQGKTAIITLLDGKTALVIPIKEKEKYAGRLVLLKNAGKRTFTAYEKQFVSIINNIISPTVESLSLYGSLQVLYLNTVKALAAAIDAKDTYTHGHSFRVARFSVAIGRQLNIPPSQLKDLEIAAYMHDLGKIGIPESILGKQGRLSPEEFREIKKHPLLTNKILEPIDLSALIVDATLQHHERLDGRGYPMGLKGDSISLFARIIAVSDVFDALTSARPYRAAMTVEDALSTICEGIDTEFDRKVVQALIVALQNYSEDQDLSEMYSELEFMHLDQLNQFLEKLTRMLLGTPHGSFSEPDTLSDSLGNLVKSI